MNPVEPVMISRKLWDGDKIILVSDGVLDAMPGAEKEQTFRDFLDGLPDARCAGDGGDDPDVCAVV